MRKRFIGLLTILSLVMIVGLLTLYFPTHSLEAYSRQRAVGLIDTARPTLTPSLTTVPPSVTPFMTSTITPTPSGQILVVNTLDDIDDGSCDAKNCSLREAIEYASWGAIINFAPGLTGTIYLNKTTPPIGKNSWTLVIDKELTINGLGPKSDALTIDGNKHEQIFIVNEKIRVSIANMTIADGLSVHSGAGIVNLGTLNVTNVTFKNNVGFAAGGILNAGNLTVINSTFTGNSAQHSGAIYSNGVLQVGNSTFQGNSTGDAGAIIAVNALITNSTINDTLFGNAKTVLKNSLVISTSDVPACMNAITNGGGNLQFPGQTCGTTIPTGDPKLGSLQDNGGPTWTMALLPGSAAIGKIIVSQCPEADQRGFLTPKDVACDIGAFQTNAVATKQ